MIKKNQDWINVMNMLSDGALIFFSYFASAFLRFEVMHGVIDLELIASRQFLAVAALYSVVIVLVYDVLHMYGSYRFRRETQEVLYILAINGGGVVLLITCLYMFRLDFSRLAMGIFWLLSSLLVTGKRVAVRALLRYFRARGYNQKHIVVIGSGKLAREYVEAIRQRPYTGVHIQGYISDNEDPKLGERLCGFDKMEEYLANIQPDELVAALDVPEIAAMPQVLAVADKEGIYISCIPLFNDYIPPHPTIEVVGNSKLINMRATPLDNIGWAAVKRTMDIVGSLVLIILTSPIMLLTAIGVKLSSPGPVLFKQERIGKNKKPFKMLKFRSMRVTGTETTGWSTNEDPRKTRFGSFIRKFSIDELPQFFNVLTGQMSLIGPRPEVPFHVEHFKEEIPLYLVRQQVRPGITGWAQVNGLRGDTSIEERVRYDIWYIENWSLWLDIKILFKTVFGGMVNGEKIN